MHQSISQFQLCPATPPTLPPPSPGFCGAFARYFSPGGKAFANFLLPGVLCCPGAGHLPTPGLFLSFWHACSFLSEYNYMYTEDITRKKADWLICQGQGVVKAYSRFYACIFPLLIKPTLYSKTRELLTWINVFWLVNQISVDIIWRTSFHSYNLFITYNFTVLY